jgi:hypothetical protein
MARHHFFLLCFNFFPTIIPSAIYQRKYFLGISVCIYRFSGSDPSFLSSSPKTTAIGISYTPAFPAAAFSSQ